MDISILNSRLRTIKLNDKLSNLKIKSSIFKGLMLLPSFSKFSESIKSDLDIQIPMPIELRVLCTGLNRDGIVDDRDLEISLDGWENIPIIDWHDSAKKATEHKISDRKGYTLGLSSLKTINGKKWVVIPGEINDRDFAYQLYLRDKRGKPLEVSAEYGWNKYWLNGELHQIDINPHLISIVDEGHIEGNRLIIKAS